MPVGSRGPYRLDVLIPAAPLRGARCAEPAHRKLWQDARAEHLLRIEEGRAEPCQCHETDTEDHRRGGKDWNAYWWDAFSPDRDYAISVCNACPIRKECTQARIPGLGGVWGGEYYPSARWITSQHSSAARRSLLRS